MARDTRGRWRRLPTPPPEAASRRGRRWSEQDERVVERFYTTHGATYTAALLGRTPLAVRHRAELLRLAGFETLTWSEKETTRLLSLYPRFSVEEIARRLDRSWGSVHAKLLKLGILDDAPERWTEAQDAVLRKRYPGAVRADRFGKEPRSRVWSMERIAHELGRSTAGVHKRALKLGMSRYSEAGPWSASDDRRLRRMKRERLHFGEIARTLRRKRVDVVERMRQLGLFIEMRPWTPDDDSTLRRLAGVVDRDEIARRLGRTPAAVRTRMSILGITAPPSRPWTARELAKLRRLYPKLPLREIAKRLGRSVSAVNNRAGLLGLTDAAITWSEQDDRTLRRLHRQGCRYDEIARRLNRSRYSIGGRVRWLGLSKEDPRRRPWSREDDARLKALYPTRTCREIGALVGRTSNAVMMRAQDLGIQSEAPPCYSAAEDAFVRANYRKMTAAAIGEKLGRSQHSVLERAGRLGLTKKRGRGRAARLHGEV